VFKNYLDYLKKCITKRGEGAENSTLSPDVIITNHGNKGVVHLCPDPLELQQGAYGQDKGFSLAIYRLPITPQVIQFILPIDTVFCIGITGRLDYHWQF
jgi:hypothetical protein